MILFGVSEYFPQHAKMAFLFLYSIFDIQIPVHFKYEIKTNSQWVSKYQLVKDVWFDMYFLGQLEDTDIN